MRRAGPSTLASAALVNLAVAHWCPRRPPSEHERTAQQPRTHCLQLPRGASVHPDSAAAGREQMHSIGLINAPFWLATIGTVLYIASMWVNGITRGLCGAQSTKAER